MFLKSDKEKQTSLKAPCGLKHKVVGLESDIILVIFTKVSHLKGKSHHILLAGTTINVFNHLPFFSIFYWLCSALLKLRPITTSFHCAIFSNFLREVALMLL